MARARGVYLREQFGVYRLTGPGYDVTGKSAEDVLQKAVRACLGEGEIEVRSNFDMAQVFETLLGDHREESGVVSA